MPQGALMPHPIVVTHGLKFDLPIPKEMKYWEVSIHEADSMKVLKTIPYLTQAHLRAPQDLPVGSYIFTMRTFHATLPPEWSTSNCLTLEAVTMPKLLRHQLVEQQSDVDRYLALGEIFGQYRTAYQQQGWEFTTALISEVGVNSEPLRKLERIELTLTAEERAIAIIPIRQVTISPHLHEYIMITDHLMTLNLNQPFNVFEMDGNTVATVVIEQLIWGCTSELFNLPFYVYKFSKPRKVGW
jgi:hypothetical protein